MTNHKNYVHMNMMKIRLHRTLHPLKTRFWYEKEKLERTVQDLAVELDISYDRLSYLVKIGQAPCYRVTPKGRPRFLPEHIEVLSDLKSKGHLY